jgi:hypothetical protein
MLPKPVRAATHVGSAYTPVTFRSACAGSARWASNRRGGTVGRNSPISGRIALRHTLHSQLEMPNYRRALVPVSWERIPAPPVVWLLHPMGCRHFSTGSANEPAHQLTEPRPLDPSKSKFPPASPQLIHAFRPRVSLSLVPVHEGRASKAFMRGVGMDGPVAFLRKRNGGRDGGIRANRDKVSGRPEARSRYTSFKSAFTRVVFDKSVLAGWLWATRYNRGMPAVDHGRPAPPRNEGKFDRSNGRDFGDLKTCIYTLTSMRRSQPR